MVLQKYSVQNEQWYIKNVGIFQALKNRENALTIDDANEWFTTIVKSQFKESLSNADSQQDLKLENIDRNTAKKLEKAYLATSALEHCSRTFIYR
ncbi:hypothetical protein WKK05_35200 [Nostoc sp. UHCC 0302]|uniref:hypothetical protein n=1 Tax=Nostoc sp. UHCC 0302 TaxID=3134896 RepID=UPI00311CC95F